MEKIKILWADDEIDLLKPQIMFLEKRGYDVLTVSNGYDALEECENTNDIDVVFLDESMPGITGLETLTKIKTANPTLPVVMITKNEAENVMEEAIGSQISDYLIKPVNPNQILLTLKKIIDNKRLVREKTASGYQQDFRQILMDINSGLDYKEWAETYKKIINWELKMDSSQADELGDILSMQKTEANAGFSKFVEKKYESWVTNKEEDAGPIMSHDLLRKKVFPIVEDGVPTVMLLLDNLRFDQWKVIEPIISELYRVEEEDFFYSSILNDNIHNYLNNDFSALVYNFIDMLSHARTEMEVLKELAGDESAYRSLTKSWFIHSPIWSALQKIAERDIHLIITTDHGTIRVKQPSRVIGDKETTTNLRYKVGRNLDYDRKDVLDFRNPQKVGLPRPNVSSTFIFAKEDKFFLYPNNYNHYNKYYNNTFQHGGISLEEIICPIIRLRSRG